MTWWMLAVTHAAVAYVFYGLGYSHRGDDEFGDYPP